MTSPVAGSIVSNTCAVAATASPSHVWRDSVQHRRAGQAPLSPARTAVARQRTTLTRRPLRAGARARYSVGETPYASRKSRLRWAGFVRPQRAPMLVTVSSRRDGSARSRRHPSSRRCRIQPETVEPSSSKSRWRYRFDTCTAAAISPGASDGSPRRDCAYARARRRSSAREEGRRPPSLSMTLAQSDSTSSTTLSTTRSRALGDLAANREVGKALEERRDRPRDSAVAADPRRGHPSDARGLEAEHRAREHAHEHAEVPGALDRVRARAVVEREVAGPKNRLAAVLDDERLAARAGG